MPDHPLVLHTSWSAPRRLSNCAPVSGTNQYGAAQHYCLLPPPTHPPPPHPTHPPTHPHHPHPTPPPVAQAPTPNPSISPRCCSYAPIFGKNQYDASQHYDPVPFEEQVAAVGELIKEGKVRFNAPLCVYPPYFLSPGVETPGRPYAGAAHPLRTSVLVGLLRSARTNGAPRPGCCPSCLHAYPAPNASAPPASCNLTRFLLQVRHWGLSNESTYGVCRHAEVAAKLGVPPPITIQASHARASVGCVGRRLLPVVS